MIFRDKHLYKLSVVFRYGDDIADEIRQDFLFEFKEEAEEKAVQIAKAFSGTEFYLSEVTEKTIKNWRNR